MNDTIDTHTLAGAYALDALTEIERAGFDRHMAVCGSCATEVAELAETAARLGAVTALTPPPALRAAVLAEIARTRQVAAGRPERSSPSNPAAQRWRRYTAGAVAAAVVAVAGVATVWVVEEDRLGNARTEVAALEAGQTRINAVLGARDVQVRTTSVAGGGRVTVALSPSSNQAVVLMSDMPAPPPGHAYQLWLIHDASPASAGVMAAGARSGTAFVGSLGGAQQVGVTVEPATGSPAPTTPTVAEVSLA